MDKNDNIVIVVVFILCLIGFVILICYQVWDIDVEPLLPIGK